MAIYAVVFKYSDNFGVNCPLAPFSPTFTRVASITVLLHEMKAISSALNFAHKDR